MSARRMRGSRKQPEGNVDLAHRLGIPTAGTPAPPPPGPGGRRAARRAEREAARARRTRWLVSAGVVCLLGLVGVLAWVLVARGSGQHPAAVGSRTQSTLLMAVTGSDGTASSAVLLAHDPATRQGVQLFVPSRVIADVPGHGSQPFGESFALPGANLPAETFTDLVGVTVDGSWTLSQAAFGALVDKLGGVTVDVDTDVLAPQPDGSQRVVVAKGRQRLSGQAAVAYASYVASGEDPQAALGRFQDVLDGILAALPTSQQSVATLVGGLGSGSTSSWPAARTATLLTGLASDVGNNNAAATILPVHRIDTGGPVAYGLDQAQTRSFVQAQLAASVPKGAFKTGNRVLVKNGVGTPGIGQSVRQRLVAAGFQYLDGGNVPGFPYASQPSVVLIYDTSDQARQRGTQVAAALHLPASAVRLDTRGQNVADVVVIVGNDYHP